MRKIPWEGDAALSDEDIRFIVQAGVPGWIERAERHQARFDKTLPDLSKGGDVFIKHADDPTARSGDLVESPGAPVLVDPLAGQTGDLDSEGDDYDEWTKGDLEKEVAARNALEDTPNVSVTGTGASGGIRKEDLVKALRLWDQENPDVL